MWIYEARARTSAKPQSGLKRKTHQGPSLAVCSLLGSRWTRRPTGPVGYVVPYDGWLLPVGARDRASLYGGRLEAACGTLLVLNVLGCSRCCPSCYEEQNSKHFFTQTRWLLWMFTKPLHTTQLSLKSNPLNKDQAAFGLEKRMSWAIKKKERKKKT